MIWDELGWKPFGWYQSSFYIFRSPIIEASVNDQYIKLYALNVLGVKGCVENPTLTSYMAQIVIINQRATLVPKPAFGVELGLKTKFEGHKLST